MTEFELGVCGEILVGELFRVAFGFSAHGGSCIAKKERREEEGGGGRRRRVKESEGGREGKEKRDREKVSVTLGSMQRGWCSSGRRARGRKNEPQVGL